LPKAGKGAGVDQSWNRTLLVLSWLWLAIVTAYSIWGAVTYSGLYRLVAELQIDQWGGYSDKWTAILPGMLLASPAFWYLRRQAAIAAAAAPAPGPDGEVRRVRRMAQVLGAIGLVSALVGIGAFLISQQLPDRAEPAVPFDAATLGTAPAPTGRPRGRRSACSLSAASATARTRPPISFSCPSRPAT
jgi:hypothetical protein